jgi:GT2 family glycosyltransferase
LDELQTSDGPGEIQLPAQRVYIIILNWNGWRDTIECLESVLRLDYPNFKVIVCDNASSDGSLDHIRSWARGETPAESRNRELVSLVSPPVPKPVTIAEIDLANTSAGANGNGAACLMLAEVGANLGFAGGNNVGLRYALQQGDCDFAWIVNNDTVVRRDALTHLVNRMRERPDAGMCGSTLIYYDNSSMVQACGGCAYDKWFTRIEQIGEGTNVRDILSVSGVEERLQFVVGASALVSKSFLEQVGLMDEQYFLTFEELDWAIRGKGRFRLAYSPRSLVYHKFGSSMGSPREPSRRSPTTEFYWTRNRILFTRKHHLEAMPSVLAAVVMSALHRLVRLRWRSLSPLLRGALQGLTTSLSIRKET